MPVMTERATGLCEQFDRLGVTMAKTQKNVSVGGNTEEPCEKVAIRCWRKALKSWKSNIKRRPVVLEAQPWGKVRWRKSCARRSQQ